MLINDRPRVNETGVFVSGWLGSLSKRTAFPFFAAGEGSFSIPLTPSLLVLFSAALFLRSTDQLVTKRGLQTSRVPGESPPASNHQFGVGERKRALPKQQPRATWNRNVIIIVGLRIRMFFRSSNLLTYYTTAHRRARNNGLASGAIPILCKCQRSPLLHARQPLHVSPRLASSLYVLLDRRIG